jgi:hypothetical protein
MAGMWYVIEYLASLILMLKTAVGAVGTTPCCYKRKITSSRGSISPISVHGFQEDSIQSEQNS